MIQKQILSLCLVALLGLAAPVMAAKPGSSSSPGKGGGVKDLLDLVKKVNAASTPEPTAQSTAEASSQSGATDSADTKAAEPEEQSGRKHKSPGKAFGLAFFPGVLVHGTGHMYAGAWLKGTGLLAIEGASVALGYQSVVNAISELDRISKLEKSNPGGAVSADYGPLMAQIGVALVCSTAFLWSWIDDMAGAATAAQQYNQVHSQSDTTLQLRPEGGIQLAWRTNF